MGWIKDKRGFTLVELIVVVAMIMVISAAMSSAVTGAHRRAKIQNAVAETQEMTNAILAYENYTKEQELPTMEEQQATESALKFILGKGDNELNGKKVPVLFNGHVDSKGYIRDPWGEPYYVTIRVSNLKPKEKNNNGPKSYVYFPNYNRRPADEVEGSEDDQSK